MLIGEHAGIGTRAAGDEACAGHHLGILLVFGIASAIEADGRPDLSFDQVKADELALGQVPADGEVVPARGVAEPSIARAAAAP